MPCHHHRNNGIVTITAASTRHGLLGNVRLDQITTPRMRECGRDFANVTIEQNMKKGETRWEQSSLST